MSIQSAFEDFDVDSYQRWIRERKKGALARKTPFSPRFTKLVAFAGTVWGRNDKNMLPCRIIVKKRDLGAEAHMDLFS